jgi:hypothetical protein
MAACALVVLAGCAGSGSAGSVSAGSSGAASTGNPTAVAVATTASPAAAATITGAGPASSTSGVHLTESNPPGDIPDTQVYVSFTPPGAHFTVSVPEGWARSAVGAGVRFTDKLNAITVTEVASVTALTATSVTSLVIPELQQQIPAFTPGAVRATTRTAGLVVLVTFTGDSAPDPVTNRVVRDAFERYAFWHNGYEAVLLLSGPINADNVDPWTTVTNSLRWQ